jgi:hypothetical protein
MIKFSRDIFIGICHALKNSKKNKINQDNSYKYIKKLLNKDCLETYDFSLLKENINFKDEEINIADHIDFDLIEYAPEIFKILRQLDGLDEEELIESLRPSKNKFSIKKTQGKGGSFFITTDDNKFIMKTITADELELVRGIFLKKFIKHLRRHPESLICRIYGIYRMITVE